MISPIPSCDCISKFETKIRELKGMIETTDDYIVRKCKEVADGKEKIARGENDRNTYNKNKMKLMMARQSKINLLEKLMKYTRMHQIAKTH